MTTESGDSWAPVESGCDQDDEDCLDMGEDGSGDGGYWDRMTTSGSRTSKLTNQRPVFVSRDLY